MNLILHCFDDYASLAVRFALEEAGLPYRTAPVDIEAGDLDSPAYRALHPRGLIPVLETPDGPVFETGAILLWLAEQAPGLAPAPQDHDRGRFLSWFLLTANTLHPAVNGLLHPERAGGDAAVGQVMARARDLIDSLLRDFNGLAVQGPWWMSPDKPSILSLYVGMLVRWLRIASPGAPDHIDPAPHQGLMAVLAGLERRPAIVRVATAEGLGDHVLTNPAYHR